ncbi:DNA polymerase kappa [Liparis tanakae]|uniref:DNA polymerase kappa n=1 Tax=Liparis tanakae TaxID=230148 RepID=A0A4Z2I898_9TELE|nr:DNA polymerase kappa [Liparis tanakae]
MRFRIEQKTMLTASAGIAPNTMLAKVCSDKNKPNGQYRLPSTREAVMEFVKNLPVRKVSGIGKVSEKMLNALGISSCSHLGQQMELLSLLFSETAWHHLMQVSLGLGSTSIPRHEERKSMSTERTFKELSNVEEQMSFCRELCEDLAEDIKKTGLKGKTVTLKVKNVNFEVKTRALTLPCAVATADEIFAVAKDLLKTEIDNESPQPLRLRLMGVRISAFVSSEDKKPLQRSIVGFLKPGTTDSSGTNQKLESKCLSYQSFQTGPLASLPLAQKCQRREEAPWGDKQGGVEGGRTSEEPKQSFFQRAHARRLQVQAANADAQKETHGEHGRVTTSAEKGVEPSKEAHQSDSTASDPSGNDSIPHVEARASTSGCGGAGSESLTCPVCFRQVETTDLNVFNAHIDQCLSEASRNPNRCTVSDTDSDVALEKGQEERHGFESNGVDPREDRRHAGNDPLQTILRSSGDDRTGTMRQPCDEKGPVLICPVCQLTQDSDDLTIFNHHVDLCLNQEVLHELGGQTASPMNPTSVINSKAIGERDSPSSPPSKKAKGLGARNTIDKFFR